MSRPKVKKVGSKVFPVYNDDIAVSVLQVSILHVHHRGTGTRGLPAVDEDLHVLFGVEQWLVEGVRVAIVYLVGTLGCVQF